MSDHKATSQQSAFHAFINYKIEHPIASEVKNKTLFLIRSSLAPQLILLTGPTGIGKSTILEYIARDIINDHKQNIAQHRDYIPVVHCTAIPSTSSCFAWKDFFMRLLSNQKVLYQDDHNRNIYKTGQRMPPNMLTDALRRQAENYFKYRRTKLLIIDEAQHIFLSANKFQRNINFECLKSLTIETGITLLLTGTYPLLDILDQSGQLARRSQIVHFRRYDGNAENDFSQFKKVLQHFEQHLADHFTLKLVANADFFYESCLGFVGILKEWLIRSLALALQTKQHIIDPTFAESVAPSSQSLITILEETLVGESRLSGSKNHEIQKLLKKNGGNSSPPVMKQRIQKSKRIGRKPKRDVVGGLV